MGTSEFEVFVKRKRSIFFWFHKEEPVCAGSIALGPFSFICHLSNRCEIFLL